MNRSRTSGAAAIVAWAGWCLVAVGCGGGESAAPVVDPDDGGGGAAEGGTVGPIDGESRHEWPPLRVDSTSGEHVIVMEGPDPGWALALDGVGEVGGARTAYVTIRRPAPGTMHPQVITEMRVTTGVASGEALGVVARVAEMDGTVPEAYCALGGEE